MSCCYLDSRFCCAAILNLGPVYTETFLRVSVTFWLRLHLPFTRKRRKRFGKQMFSKTASKVELFENAAVSQPCKRTKRNVSETIRSRTRRWRSLSVKEEARLPPWCLDRRAHSSAGEFHLFVNQDMCLHLRLRRIGLVFSVQDPWTPPFLLRRAHLPPRRLILYLQ